MSGPPALRTLADRMGILASYVDVNGIEHATSDDTRVALLHAMHVDAGTDPAARRELERLDAEDRGRLIEPVYVHRAGAPAAVRLRAGGRGEWIAELRLEDGAARTLRGELAAGDGAIPLPAPLPTGYHELRVSVRDADGERGATQRLIVAPTRCVDVAGRAGPGRRIGVLANLYTVRSAANWGCGDLGDLRALAAWARGAGASFVGVNPLHATRNRGHDVSPYYPTSRLFRNPIYLDVT
ncbi:MAG: hypothetical protein B7Z72_06040, partial [Gemmatimonadetes bacterium 21-71-4]